jgi:uncharacterized protein (TIGR03437 family)
MRRLQIGGGKFSFSKNGSIPAGRLGTNSPYLRIIGILAVTFWSTALCSGQASCPNAQRLLTIPFWTGRVHVVGAGSGNDPISGPRTYDETNVVTASFLGGTPDGIHFFGTGAGHTFYTFSLSDRSTTEIDEGAGQASGEVSFGIDAQACTYEVHIQGHGTVTQTLLLRTGNETKSNSALLGGPDDLMVNIPISDSGVVLSGATTSTRTDMGIPIEWKGNWTLAPADTPVIIDVKVPGDPGPPEGGTGLPPPPPPPPPLPPGGLFIVDGLNLCQATAYATPPYPTSLGGVTVQFTPDGGPAVPAFLEGVYCEGSVTQLAGVLPSGLEVGNYQVTVSNGGATASLYVKVVPHRFMLLTLNGSGTGRALAQNVVSQTQYDLNGPTKSAVPGASFLQSPAYPGEYMIAWGMGLGGVAGYDNVAPAAGVNLLDQGLDVKVLVGGSQIAPVYAGLSNLYPGLDNIVFQLPANTATGCTVPLQVRVGAPTGDLSNLTTIAIAPNSTATACVAAP